MTGKLPTNYSLNILMNFLLSEYANSLRLDELSPEKKASTPNPEWIFLQAKVKHLNDLVQDNKSKGPEPRTEKF